MQGKVLYVRIIFMSLQIVFMGSSEFSVKILEILAGRYSLCGVVTQPDKPAGRGKTLTAPPVKILAETLNIPVLQPVKLKDPESFAQLANLQPDLIVVAAYGQILRKNVLELPRFGCINVHASLLPRWRGASPIQAAILHGDNVTGVTIMKMDAGIDTGPVLAKKEVDIDKDETSKTLSEKLAEVGGQLLIQTLPDYLNGNLTPVPQDEVGANYVSMINKEDGLLEFRYSAERLEHKVRAYIDWPGAYMDWEGQSLKIRKARVAPLIEGTPGRRIVRDGYPAVETVDGELVLLEVQPAGKKWMDGKDFLRGARNWLDH